MSRSNEGATMLVSVLVFVFIMSIVMLGVMQMVTSRTKRAVAWEDTNVTFFAAEASINDVFSRLLVSESWPPDWTGLSASDGDKYEDELVVNGVKVKRKLTYIENAESGDYIDIEVRAKGSRRSVRKVVGKYTKTGVSGSSEAMIVGAPGVSAADIEYIPDGVKKPIPAGETYISKKKNVDEGSNFWGFKTLDGPASPETNEKENLKKWHCKDKCQDFDLYYNKSRIVIGMQDGKLKVVEGKLSAGQKGYKLESVSDDLVKVYYDGNKSTNLEYIDGSKVSEVVVGEPALIDVEEDMIFLVLRHPDSSKDFTNKGKHMSSARTVPNIVGDVVTCDNHESEYVTNPCVFKIPEDNKGVLELILFESLGINLNVGEKVESNDGEGESILYFEMVP